MATMNMYWNDPILPWSETENDQRYKKILRFTLIFFVVASLIIPFLPVPETEKKKLEQVSPRLAKLIIEKKKQKPPAPKVKPRIVKKKVTPKASKKTKIARKKAQQSGLMAMRKELAALQDAFDMSALNDSTPLSKADTSRTTTSKRSSAEKSAKKGSGGINTSSLSTKTGGTGLSGRSRTAVTSDIGSGGGSGKFREASKKVRTEEEIALVFEKNKGAIFSLYNRALRKDPTLQGKVVLELTINASGKVTKCKIISSELNNKSLERKLIARVKLFRFSAKQVKSTTVTYPIDFLPS
ncbi:MAG: TonB family protein [Gammaproteobacteria bacterium]|nr:TonB family protein [Gammaproteobacteria bacterium]